MSPESSRRSAPHSKEALLFALRGIFEVHGFDGATLSRLAAATGLGKASLYHHFPGGKTEMAAVLLRESVAELERLAFSKLAASRPPMERLAGFIEGFQEYTRDGEGNCLLLLFSEGGAREHFGRTISVQYRDWLQRIATVFMEAGNRPKKSERLARDLLAGLYGHLVTAKMVEEPQRFTKYVKQLKKQIRA